MRDLTDLKYQRPQGMRESSLCKIVILYALINMENKI